MYLHILFIFYQVTKRNIELMINGCSKKHHTYTVFMDLAARRDVIFRYVKCMISMVSFMLSTKQKRAYHDILATIDGRHKMPSSCK